MRKSFMAICMIIALVLGATNMAFAATDVTGPIEFDTGLLQNAELIGMDADGSVKLRVIQPKGFSRNGYQIVDETLAKIVPLTDEARDDLAAAARAANSNYKEIADRSYQITLYSTTKWETKVSNNRGYKRLTGFSGGIRASGTGIGVGSGVVIASSKIVYGAVGIGENGRVNGGTTITLQAGTRSYSYSRTSAWVYILDPNGIVGHNFTVGLKSGTGTPWNTTLINNV